MYVSLPGRPSGMTTKILYVCLNFQMHACYMFRPPQYPSCVLHSSLYHAMLPLLARINDMMSSSRYPRCTDLRVCSFHAVVC
jgi:hypothetical protein